ncbi:MAG: membrane bound O-acyl transferase family-domain-containing protein [Cytophagaceae bacterium]|nr:membrane bound O-acyl transferase family-domain-containing protein [Cytophagaceae bacterium]
MLSGYFIPFFNNRTTARVVSWSMTLACTAFSIYISMDQPPLIRMIAITSIQLLTMKVIVLTETYKGKPKISFFQWLAFAQGWFGMRPALFEALISKPRSGVFYFVVKGFSRISMGIVLLIFSKLIRQELASTLFLLIGLSFILHFGILNVGTAFWRALGVDVKELFINPYRATSLKEFWGKRWNMAFSEMTALIVYKPLLSILGKQQAVVLSFLFSGILHEIAISFPVQSGYGLPLLYFAIHALVMYCESKIPFVQRITSHSALNHIWVMAWLILPLPLLFHKQFIIEVARPLANTILQTIHLN